MYNILTHWRVLVNSCTVSELCPALTIVLFEADGHQNTELQNIKLGAACPILKALKNILWFSHTILCIQQLRVLCEQLPPFVHPMLRPVHVLGTHIQG